MPPQPTLSDLDNAPTTLPNTSSAETPADDVATLTQRLQEVSEDFTRLQQEYDAYRKENKGIDHLNDMIKPYASKIYNFMVCYCLVVAYILIENAAGRFPKTIDSTVMSFLVGSTATTVLGLVGMVVTGIFSGVRKHKEETSLKDVIHLVKQVRGD